MADNEKKKDEIPQIDPDWERELKEALADLGDAAASSTRDDLGPVPKREPQPETTAQNPHSKKGRLNLVYSSGRHKIRKRR